MKLLALVVATLCVLFSFPHFVHAQSTAALWLTTLDKTSLLAPQPDIRFVTTPVTASLPVITITDDSLFQSIDGFGFALTGGSAQHIIRMSADKRNALLQELFGKNGIGISYLRLSIGASDLNDRVFSYIDTPGGSFDLSQDKEDVIPVMKQILAINPSIKILGSPWSAPVWMKTNNNIQGGRLKEEYYGKYADYFVKYVQEMRKQGIIIDAITVQNEPFNNGNTPSMQMFAKEQARFIRDHLGPAFKKNAIKTKIILYDHNCDAPEYPISILTDAKAAQYIDGSGFHLYAGPITALSKVHTAFPNKHLYFTEMMAVNRNEFNVAAPVNRIVIGAIRNWSRNVILWNLAANSKFEPHTGNGGCSICQGAVTIDGDSVQRNLAYYTIAHASKFIAPGSVRIQSNAGDSVTNVAFKTPEGKIAVIVANPSQGKQSFIIRYKDRSFEYALNRGDVATFIW